MFRSRLRDFCQIFEGFGFGQFGLGKKVSRKRVSVSENLVAEKKSRYRCRSKFWYHHSVCGVRAALLIERVPTLYQKLLNSHSLNEKAT